MSLVEFHIWYAKMLEHKTFITLLITHLIFALIAVLVLYFCDLL